MATIKVVEEVVVAAEAEAQALSVGEARGADLDRPGLQHDNDQTTLHAAGSTTVQRKAEQECKKGGGQPQGLLWTKHS